MWAEFDLGAGACDRRFVLEPPFLRLQVVAGAALLVFGHRFVSWLALWLASVAGSLPNMLFIRAATAFQARLRRERRTWVS